jgi:hypothetical protein
MAEKVKYKRDVSELHTTGVFDETTALGTNEKGKIVSSSGDFIGLGWEEEDDILITNGTFPNTGSFSGSYNRYTQTNMSVTAKRGAAKDGNSFAYVIKRNPDISSTSTWGGVSLYPPDALQRISGRKFRFSFDYRGYSNNNSLDVYQNYSIGWGNMGIGLPGPWGQNVSSFDTDWEWRRYEKEFEVTDYYADWIPGSNQPAWNSTTQYGTGWFALTYNGYVYRHRSGWAAPTLGVDPETEYQAGGVYDWRVPMTAGYLNLYRNIKIGFNYNTQGTRGTHVHVDNITLTDITGNETFKYDIANGTWIAENLVEDGLDILAKGTAYVALPRSDTGTDIFAVEGNRYLSINGTEVYNTSGRGLRLTTFNSAGSVLSNVTYDVYGSSTARSDLATALSGIDSNTYWALTSFDAIRGGDLYDSEPALRNQLISMGSRFWNPNDECYILYNTQVRNTYAAVGKGQKLIKEDGANAADSVYKRKAVIQTRIS